jgi:uncharacterized protein YodC (DUF2158 family)
MANFKPGDLVVLESGGPVMTVEDVNKYASNDITCVWFAGAKREFASFQPHSLELAPPKDTTKK